MRIAIDFDNTLVNYDAIFHRVAMEQNVIPADLAATKLAVRDYLRRNNKEEVWTEMQGYVYGARMSEAETYPGALEFLHWLSLRNIPVAIISHKTKHPFLGPQYDLHQAARVWIEHNLIDDGLIQMGNIFFELTKEEKLARIAHWRATTFIDDLPEILLAEQFPLRVNRILFDPDKQHRSLDRLVSFNSWNEILRHVNHIDDDIFR